MFSLQLLRSNIGPLRHFVIRQIAMPHKELCYSWRITSAVGLGLPLCDHLLCLCKNDKYISCSQSAPYANLINYQ